MIKGLCWVVGICLWEDLGVGMAEEVPGVDCDGLPGLISGW